MMYLYRHYTCIRLSVLVRMHACMHVKRSLGREIHNSVCVQMCMNMYIMCICIFIYRGEFPKTGTPNRTQNNGALIMKTLKQDPPISGTPIHIDSCTYIHIYICIY